MHSRITDISSWYNEPSLAQNVCTILTSKTQPKQKRKPLSRWVSKDRYWTHIFLSVLVIWHLSYGIHWTTTPELWWTSSYKLTRLKLKPGSAASLSLASAREIYASSEESTHLANAGRRQVSWVALFIAAERTETMGRHGFVDCIS